MLLSEHGEVMDSASDKLRTLKKPDSDKRKPRQGKTRKYDPFLQCIKNVIRCHHHHPK